MPTSVGTLSQLTIPVMNGSTGEITNQTYNLSSGAVTIKTTTLAASGTTVTFTGIPTTGTNLIDFYIDGGSGFSAINTSTSGQVTLTYPASSAARTVCCRIEEVSS